VHAAFTESWMQKCVSNTGSIQRFFLFFLFFPAELQPQHKVSLNRTLAGG
jgi:hypothetical protein